MNEANRMFLRCVAVDRLSAALQADSASVPAALASVQAYRMADELRGQSWSNMNDQEDAALALLDCGEDLRGFGADPLEALLEGLCMIGEGFMIGAWSAGMGQAEFFAAHRGAMTAHEAA